VTPPNLFTPLACGDLQLRNRIVMAPLTRSRAGRTHVPNELMTQYYAQRASAGLIITEATMIAPDACAFIGEGGLYDEATTAGWRRVTDAVHRHGGLILVQLWHPGRAAHSSLNGGVQPVSSTDRAIRGSKIRTLEGEKDYEAPRRLTSAEMPGIVELFRAGCVRAREAGFDGVQIHAAHGYLIDQFLRDSVNDRSDDYGGSLANRARLLFEVVDAANAVLGAGRVAVRISPLVPYNDIADAAPSELVRHVAAELDRRRIAFLELRHADHSRGAEAELGSIARRSFSGALLVNGGYERDSATAAVASGAADAVVFGKHYVANPDLVERFAAGATLSRLNPGTLYSPGPAGYTDYPSVKLGT
jgi:N-ethylmaleimide reductase